MTPRRRFFPSTKTQGVPGKSVDISVHLQPVSQSTPATPASSGGGGSGSVALLPDLLPYAGEFYYDPESGFPLQATPGLWRLNVLRPAFSGWRVVGGYVPIQPPSDEGARKSTLRAVALGADAGNVTWSWSLDTPAFPSASYIAWWDGVSLEVQDGTLKITVLPGEIEDWADQWWATLTCIASSGGAELGRIILRPGLNLSDYGSLPLPT